MRKSRRAALHSSGLNVAEMVITYTGTMTDELVTMSGVEYRLLTLTTSGTLAFDEAVKADVCVVGGGCGGATSNAAAQGNGGAGGAGAFMKNVSSSDFIGGTANIGAGGGTSTVGGETSIGNITSGVCSVTNSGGSGGGQPGHGASTAPAIGTGDGLSKYPFGETTYFSGKPHCGGGGGGGFYYQLSGIARKGGDGGTNGGNGGACSTLSKATTGTGGAGGSYGGGAGGTSQSRTGSAATYYGSGGGGGGAKASTSNMNGTGGSGYQGVIYIRIPLDQSA